ncbi:hypothetical protein [Qipengyuania sediminis]|uniref:hypothetical protein n=1 Tax=Qipengyuania sediminis TaxID=1532023 RepID=UPI0010599F21|nr:hypothetical protein [Qipengyuania sediminis]
MGTINVHAGDWKKGKGSYGLGVFLLPRPLGWEKESINSKHLTEVEVASEESVKRLGGAAGWGVAGAVLLGPVGLLAGALLGGRGKDVTFIARFRDGRKFLATTDSKTFIKIQSVVF